MPTYAYTCPQGHEFEIFERKISSKLKAKCPTCGRMAIRQISGGMGFHLKGSGFYATDYKSDKSGSDKSDSGKPGSDKPSSESTSDSTSDTKSDAKSDTKAESKPKKDVE